MVGLPVAKTAALSCKAAGLGQGGCGVTVAPESADAMAQGPRRLLVFSAPERQAMGQRGRAFVLAEHTYPVLARRFLAACQSDR